MKNLLLPIGIVAILMLWASYASAYVIYPSASGNLSISAKHRPMPPSSWAGSGIRATSASLSSGTVSFIGEEIKIGDDGTIQIVEPNTELILYPFVLEPVFFEIRPMEFTMPTIEIKPIEIISASYRYSSSGSFSSSFSFSSLQPIRLNTFSTPIPSAGLLFFTGLLGLFRYRRKF